MYINKKEFYKEIIVSKAQGKLTKQAENMLILLGKEVVKKMRYDNRDDRNDCLQEAMFTLFSNWRNFDEEITNNPFAFYTEIIKRGLAKGWNKLYKKRGDETAKIISLHNF